jgi:hypothetical protein
MEPPTPTAAPPPAEQPTNNPLSVMEPGEQTICEIRRHPIGIIGKYVAAGFVLVVLAVVLFVVVPHVFSSMSRGRMAAISGLVFVVAAVIAAGFLWVVRRVYWANRWIVTSDSITQVKQTSLFDKQTSQLSLGDLEDITAEQDGPVAQMFHFGVISAETAGATDKFTFPYCPNPNDYAKQILAARERFEQSHHQDA